LAFGELAVSLIANSQSSPVFPSRGADPSSGVPFSSSSAA
jgi:hypothetical protein